MPIVSAELKSARPPKIFWPLLGLIIVLPVYGITMLVLGGLLNSLKLLSLVPSIAALLVGVPAWWIFVVKPGQATVRRGMAVGVFSSITAHPVMWTIYLGLTWVQPRYIFSAFLVTQLLPAILAWTLLSLIFVGWLTTLCGWFMGFCLIHLQRALTRASQWRTLRTTRKAEIIQRREMSSIEQAQKKRVSEEHVVEDVLTQKVI